MDDFVLAGEYENRLDADIIKAYLEQEGIESLIQADDGGGTMPYLAFSNGVRIFVLPKDLERAQTIMHKHRLP